MSETVSSPGAKEYGNQEKTERFFLSDFAGKPAKIPQVDCSNRQQTAK
jgi:hypothetical protein